MKNLFSTLVALLILSIFISAKSDTGVPSTGAVLFRFNHFVGNLPLKLNDTSAVYKNGNGDDFKVTTFKYYISNIAFTTSSGTSVQVPESYLLVNAADSISLCQRIANIPSGIYTGISFTIGVDSARNFAGAQTGSLDPANGMFWSWNSGYIFLKLEGESSKSAAKFHKLIFHVGGVKNQNTIRYYTQQLPVPLIIAEKKTSEIDLAVDAGSLFKGKSSIDFSKLSYTMGGPNALIIADNYAGGMFHVSEVKN